MWIGLSVRRLSGWLPSSYQVSSQSVFPLSRTFRNRFWRWRPSWISDWNDFSYVLLYKLPWYFLPSSSQFDFRFRRRSAKKIFKSIGGHGSHLGFPQFLIYSVSQYFLSSFETNDLSVHEKKRKIDFQDGGHLVFPNETILAIFDLQVASILQLAFRVRRRSTKCIFKMAVMAAILDFQSEWF